MLSNTFAAIQASKSYAKYSLPVCNPSLTFADLGLSINVSLNVNAFASKFVLTAPFSIMSIISAKYTPFWSLLLNTISVASRR